jgi:hypothetical protein
MSARVFHILDQLIQLITLIRGDQLGRAPCCKPFNGAANREQFSHFIQ